MRSRSLALQSLVARLATQPGVERVLADDRASVVVLICQPAAPREPIASAAAELVGELGLAGIEIEVTVRSQHRRARRIRFLNVFRDERPDRTIELTVHLEWDGIAFSGSAVSQPGEVPELRGVASAALATVCQIAGRNLGLRVAGVKRVRSFDSELMVASLYHSGPPRQQLVGAVVTGPDPHRAACLAVLNGLNRLLGKYLDR